VWENSKVEVWYAQNTILHVSSRRLAADEAMRAAREKNAFFPLSVVHPNPVEERVSHAVGWRKRRKLKRQVERLEGEFEVELSKGPLRRILGRRSTYSRFRIL
jgi:hypothetical protein